MKEKQKGVIEFEESLRIVMSGNMITGSEEKNFLDSIGRVLGEDVMSDIDMPPFNKAAVDGFACKRIDLKRPLKIVETVQAGQVPEKAVSQGECTRIMTGAAIPEGADYVFMVEDSTLSDEEHVIFTGKEGKNNIAVKAEDVKAGDIVLNAGRFIQPQDIAVMASVGKTVVRVGVQPKIGIISTGDELVEPDVVPSASMIRNSNAYQLMAQVTRAGAKPTYYGIALDSFDDTFTLVTRALSENDILLMTGGVSVGEWDFVPEVLKRAGVEIIFDRVNVQPGKPTTFGTYSNGYVFGLPGNPVSSFVQFELLVRPLIAKMMGLRSMPRDLKLKMGKEWRRKRGDRLTWIPVTIDGNSEVFPVEYHGSAHISALPKADAIIPVQPGKTELKTGEIVSVRPV